MFQSLRGLTRLDATSKLAAMRLSEPDTKRWDVATQVRVVLAELQISGSELARRCGVGQRYMSRRITGEVEFTASEIRDVARALDVSVSRLFGEPCEVMAP